MSSIQTMSSIPSKLWWHVKDFIKLTLKIFAVMIPVMALIFYAAVYQPEYVAAFMQSWLKNVAAITQAQSTGDAIQLNQTNNVIQALAFAKYAVLALCAIRWRWVCERIAQKMGKPQVAEELYRRWPLMLTIVLVIEIVGML